jgi:RNA polymerase sigma factor (sigma-70 family)
MAAQPTSSSDDALDAQRASAGDAQAFERLYFRHAGRIRTVARRLLGPAHADDGVQEVFLRAWTKLHTYRGDSAFGTWLYRLGLNVLLRELQKGRRHAEFETIDEHDLVTPPASTIGSHIDRALQSLNPRLREVVVLHDMEDHTHEDIAALLDISVSASKMRLQRARTALRSFMTEGEHV